MNSIDLSVSGGRVYVNGSFRQVTLGVRDGSVSQIVSDEISLDADRTLDLDGEYVIPGLVDGHVHLREPGYKEKEGIRSGSAAAAAGGVTTIIEMPNTMPPVLTADRLSEKRRLFKTKSCVDFALFGAITEENVGTGDIGELAASGVTAFKTFMATSFGPLLMDDKGVLYRAFEEVAETGRPIYVHAEDEQYLTEFARRANNENGIDAFLSSRPPIAETTAIADVIEIARETGAETIVPHVTTAAGLEKIVRAREDGVQISAEVTPYHLTIDDETLRDIGTIGIGTPPVRDMENKERLQAALAAGDIQLLGSDHAPHTLKEKQRPALEVAPGMPQLETALPLLLSAVNRGDITLARVIECYAENPARIHGLYPQKGSLHIGADADFVVVDLNRHMTIDAETFESTGMYSPFDGWSISGMPTAVYQRGELIAEEMNTVTNPGSGDEYRSAPDHS